MTAPRAEDYATYGKRPPERDWPAPPHEAAYAGLAGDVVRFVEPHTEADPVAVLVSFLAGFGMCVGSRPHVMVGAEPHRARLFAVLVGRTSKARKGSSWWPVELLLRYADAVGADRIVTGLGSGEGLVSAFQVGDDSTPADARALVYAGEFSRVLRVAGRDGSTLSSILRDCWDRDDIRILVRRDPVWIKGAHVAVLGHITAEELRRELTDTDAASGFGNRFLWVPVKRQRMLPDPPAIERESMKDVGARVYLALDHARSRDVIRRTEAFRRQWEDAYPLLSRDDRYGLAGLLTSRAEAQVLRLALVYALLDDSDELDVGHLASALALWDYLERGAVHLFGSLLGDPVADEIERALRERGEMTRTDIRELFGRHRSSDRIGAALALLERVGRAHREERPTAGRPAEVWVSGPPRTSAESAESAESPPYGAYSAYGASDTGEQDTGATNGAEPDDFTW